mgnify:CR=1 FL=1|jgi:hypothetical protein
MKNLIRRIIKETVDKMEQFKDEYVQPHITFANTPATKTRLEASISKKYGFTNKKEYYLTTNNRGEVVVKIKA